MTGKMEVLPATSERWHDLESLFGLHGAYWNCWCMFWRLRRVDFSQMKPEERKAALKEMTEREQVPGVLAYQDGQAVGWCSIAPREQFVALEKSRILKRVDDQPVWSIVCFFVAKPQRGQGVLKVLLQGAVAYAARQGARIVEGYPIDLQAAKLQGRKLTGCSGYMGIASAFRAAGFVQVGEASETQCIMRWSAPAEK